MGLAHRKIDCFRSPVVRIVGVGLVAIITADDHQLGKFCGEHMHAFELEHGLSKLPSGCTQFLSP